MSGAAGTPFSGFVQLMERITQERGAKRKDLLTTFFKAYGWGDFYPVYRLLLPALDKERRSYQMKEAAIAKLYVEALAIDNNSEAGQRLLKYRIPSEKQRQSGDFGTAVYMALEGRLPAKSTITVAQVNAYLDRLASATDKPARKQILQQMLHETTALMQKWLVRIILKDLKMGSGEKIILGFLHPDAIAQFNVTTNLRKVCEELTDPSVRSEDKMIRLFSNVKSMMANQRAPDALSEVMTGDEFVVETKFDGNRMQVHRQGNEFAYFSRNGLNSAAQLAPVLNRVFLEYVNADNYILDTEILIWHEEEKRFGKFKEVRSIGASTRDEQTASGRVVAIVFDVLMVNGKSMIHLSLRERIALISSIVRPKEKVLEVIRRQIVTTVDEVSAAFDIATQNGEEGIMVKLLDEQYVPAGREKCHWYKIKPDYVSGLSPNLDLAIIGAFYGEGNGGRSGTLSTFLMGIPAPVAGPGSKLGDKWLSLTKVGTGYTYEQLRTIQYKLETHCKPWIKAKPPKFIELTPTAELPHVYVDPRDCCVVLEVFGASMEPTDKYCVGHTMRHPRCKEIRRDKGIEEVATLEQVQLEIERKARTHAEAVASGAGQANRKKKAKTVGQKKKIVTDNLLAPSFRSGEVEAVGDTFVGKQFVVFLSDKNAKTEIERIIVEMRGELSAFPGERTFCIVSEDNDVRVKLHIQKGKHDIVRASWVHECVKDGRLVPFVLRHVMYATEKTREEMRKVADEYGDSYTEPVTPDLLKKIFGSIQLAQEYTLDNCLYQEEQLFPKKPFFSMFGGLFFYFDPDAPLELAQLIAKHYQGAVCSKVEPRVTHVVMRKELDARYEALETALSKLPPHATARKRLIVSSDWLFESAEMGEPLVESKFLMKTLIHSRKQEARHLASENRKRMREKKEVIRGTPSSFGSLNL